VGVSRGGGKRIFKLIKNLMEIRRPNALKVFRLPAKVNFVLHLPRTSPPPAAGFPAFLTRR
jgi:hypothetical protein